MPERGVAPGVPFGRTLVTEALEDGKYRILFDASNNHLADELLTMGIATWLETHGQVCMIIHNPSEWDEYQKALRGER